MPRQPVAHVAIDLPEGVPAITRPEVVGPPFEMPIEVADQFGQRLKVALGTDDAPQLLALSRQRFAGWVHAPVAQLSPTPVSIQPKAVTQEVQGRPRLAQGHHSGLLPI